MVINFNEKIEKINNDRILMLKAVKEKIVKDNDLMSDNIENTIAFFAIDDKNVNEYNSILKAKNLILELILEISMATSVEDIIKLRNKINYQVNKIKKELLRRNISQALFNQFYNKVTELRKNIAMYLRFLKRESILIEIRELYDKINDLSDEDSVRLKKLLANELKYNKRVLKSIYSEPENIFQNKNKETLIVKDSNSERHDIKINVPKEKKKVEDEDEFLDLFVQQMNDIVSSNKSQLENDLTSQDYLKKRIGYYRHQYNLYELFGYNNNFLKNCISFFGNIPKYIWNKRIINNAHKDYSVFYHGEDFGGFINYSRKRNSIIVALQAIFKSSRLSQREIECLFNHEKCMEWIMEFYNHQSSIPNDSMKLVRTNNNI